MRHIFSLVLSLLLLSPTLLHAEGTAGGVDRFSDDQVRSFTQTETLPGGLKATATILALHKHQKDVTQVFAHAFREARELADQFLAGNPNSEIARLNNRAAQEPVRVAPGTLKLLEVAKKAHKLTDGAFDIVREGGTADDIKINRGAQTVQFLKPLRLDVSSVLDGFLADRLTQVIWDANIDNAMVEVGAVTRSLGNDTVGPWRKVIADMAGQYVGRGMAISFSNASTATVTVGAKSPKTGGRGAKAEEATATRCRSATIITKDATTAQALANAVYQLGPQAGLELATRVPQTRAIIRDNAGNLVKSPGL